MNELTTQQPQQLSATSHALATREAQEVQAMVAVAKRFPRDEKTALDNILNDCTRKSLAESALYSFARGGTDITGPSIRLAEAIAQRWQNVKSGWRVISVAADHGGVKASTVEAFAWDLENNNRKDIAFDVRHWRDTKQGGYALKDERDVYELIANMAQRRLRNCILAMIPGDVIEAAQKQCETTVATSADVTPDGIAKLVAAFEKFGVKKEAIEKRIQRRVDTITAAQVVSLRKIYTSIKDGMSKAEEWFKADDKAASPLDKAAKKQAADAPTEDPAEDLPFVAEDSAK